MTVDPHTPAQLSQQPPCRAKVRIRFRKGGALRLISHHDLIHCFERMFRRAKLRVHTTQGFHPKPRVVFAQSLALGIIGCREVVEIELDETRLPEEIHRQLAGHAPPGLEFLEVKSIDTRAKAAVRRAGYRMMLPCEACRDLPERIATLLATAECWIERTRPQARRLNIRPYILDLRLDKNVLELLIWVTPNGTARPEEVLQALDRCGPVPSTECSVLGHLLEQDLIIERHLLELEDEMSAAERERIPAFPLPGSQGREKATRSEGENRPTALLSGPLAFDS